jgi:hypothetical protein
MSCDFRHSVRFTPQPALSIWPIGYLKTDIETQIALNFNCDRKTIRPKSIGKTDRHTHAASSDVGSVTFNNVSLLMRHHLAIRVNRRALRNHMERI